MASAQPVRVNVNAAIVRGDELLLIEFNDDSGVHYNFPGGGLEPGEAIEDGLKRECLEEACVEVEVERLLCVWEYVPEKEGFKYGNRQKVGLVFLCLLKDGAEPRLPNHPDANQVGVRWMKLADLEKIPVPVRPPVFPAIEKPLIEAIRSGRGPLKIWSEK